MATPALMCVGATLEGDVQVGQGVILHPHCHISAQPGAAVVIGARTIVEELVVIKSTHGTVSIGEQCLLQVGCRIQDSSIGKSSDIEIKACLLNSQVGNNCSVGAMCFLDGEIVTGGVSIHAPSNRPVGGRDVDTHTALLDSLLEDTRRRIAKAVDLEAVPVPDSSQL
mmetsp:Transcript_84845/g.137595  ORF Transcript_84845/g.137595 Transcript_84845/m.137595 type:complete len:168 (-) Transcript_84845:94-597(-)